MKNVGYKLYPHQSSDECDIFEAFSLGKIKIIREEYMDYLRGITPLFFALLEKIILKQMHVDLNDFYEVSVGLNKTLVKKWNPSKVMMNKELCNAITKNGQFELTKKVVSSVQLVEYIGNNSTDKRMIDSIKLVREIEESVRNPIAHCITYLNEEVIKEATGMNAKGIFNKIKNLMAYAGIKVTEDDLLTYEKLNQEIKKYL